MKYRICDLVFALLIMSCFLITSQLEAQTAYRSHSKQQQYKLIDLGALGGPSSIIFGATGPLNNAGMVAQCADTAMPDPFYPNDNPYFSLPSGPDPFVEDAFLWTYNNMRDLGTLPGGLGSCGQWINNNGVVVGAAGNGLLDSSTGYPAINAVRWRNGKIRNLGTLGGEESVAFAVNDQGQIAGGASTGIPDNFPGLLLVGATQARAFLWERGKMQDLGTLGGPDSVAFYINERGEVAGQSLTNSTPNDTTGIPTVDSFLWKNGRMIDLGNLGGTFGFPNAVNNYSQVAGASDLPGDLTEHPFFWEKGRLTDIGTLGGNNGEAVWINDAGQVVGTADLADGTHHAFVWRKGRMKDLGTVGSDPCSNGKGINSFGLATGTTTDCHGNILHLFLWKEGKIVNLSALIRPGSDVIVTDLVMINDRGEIAGEGVTADGAPRAVLLVPDGDCDRECEGRLATGDGAPWGESSSMGSDATTSALSSRSRLNRIGRGSHGHAPIQSNKINRESKAVRRGTAKKKRCAHLSRAPEWPVIGKKLGKHHAQIRRAALA